MTPILKYILAVGFAIVLAAIGLNSAHAQDAAPNEPQLCAADAQLAGLAAQAEAINPGTIAANGEAYLAEQVPEEFIPRARAALKKGEAAGKAGTLPQAVAQAVLQLCLKDFANRPKNLNLKSI